MMPIKIIAGVDEAGRGPLAGPVVAAAVILNPNHNIKGLTDSKKLSEKKREQLYTQIIANSIWAISDATVEEIDTHNIFQATFLAMQRAVAKLTQQPHLVKVDGKFLPELPYAAEAIIQGDITVPEISAASILAKVTRDRQMCILDQQYPEYGFKQHKGYGTAAHMAALREHGPTPVHRTSFKPVAQLCPS